MNVTQKNVDSVNIVLSVEMNQSDYAEEVEKQLKKYRRRAEIPGFRPGMAPMSLLKRTIGEKLTADVVNEMVSKALYNYISEQKINVLGEPMLVKDQEPVDFKTAETFTVSFDIAVAPAFSLTLDQSVRIPHYVVTVENDMLENRINGYRTQYGTTVDGETVAEDDVIKGSIAELDAEGNILDGGVTANETNLYPRYFSDEAEKAKFIGAKKDTTVDFCLSVATGGNATEMASILQVDKEKAKALTGNFRFTIQQISHLEQAELNEELFQKVCGEECLTEEEFRAAVKANIESSMAGNSDMRFVRDLRNTLMAQVGELTYPVETLKRWIIKKNDKDADKVDEEMPQILQSLTWQLIEEKILADYNLKVSDEDIKKVAVTAFVNQMKQFGIMDFSDDHAAAYAASVLKDEKQRDYYRDLAVTQCIIAKVRELVTIDEKTVTLEELAQMN